MWSSVVRWWRQNHWWCLWLQTQYIYVPPHDCERLFFPIHPKVPLIQDPAHFLLVTSPVTNIAASFLLLDDVNWIFLGFGVLNCNAIFQLNHPLYQPLFAFFPLFSFSDFSPRANKAVLPTPGSQITQFLGLTLHYPQGHGSSSVRSPHPTNCGWCSFSVEPSTFVSIYSRLFFRIPIIIRRGGELQPCWIANDSTSPPL